MKPLMDIDTEAKSKAWGVVQDELISFANVGLRCLILGSRQLTVEEARLYHEQRKEIDGRPDGDEKKKAFQKLTADIECKLELHGCSAIEDKLQEGIEIALPRIRNAGIKVWVLTGDTTGTAIEIGNSCKLLDTHTQNIAVLEQWSPYEHGFAEDWDPPRGSKTHPRVIAHTRDRLFRLLQELDETPSGDPAYGPRLVPGSTDDPVMEPPDPALALSTEQEGGELLAMKKAMKQVAEILQARRELEKANPPDLNSQLIEHEALHSVAVERLSTARAAYELAATNRREAYNLRNTAHPFPLDWPFPVDYERLDGQHSMAKYLAGRMDDADGSCSEVPSQNDAHFIRRRPLKQHPLAIVIHSAVLKAAMNHDYCTDAGEFLAEAPTPKARRETHVRAEPPTGAWSRTLKGETYASCLDIFAELGRRSNVVLCCRVSPGQKADVVQVMGKDCFNKISLAIGDGANDVPMIKQANIGVGIIGHEGTQAVQAADYAIGQFQFLQRLLLVHGRWSYKRISKVILFFFYKNTMLALTAMWLCRHNGYSGQSLFDGIIASAYNLMFTALPVIFMAVFERDIDDVSADTFSICACCFLI
eukprot:SAG22_NODE_530_length_9427_cov_3.306818_7_plen_590_part_00